MSVMMTSVMEMMPPPPEPWIERPTSMAVKFLAVAQTMEPIVKRVMAKRRRGRRPQRWEKVMKLGCQTMEVRRKDVPAQKAWMASPLRATVITFGVSIKG